MRLAREVRTSIPSLWRAHLPLHFAINLSILRVHPIPFSIMSARIPTESRQSPAQDAIPIGHRPNGNPPPPAALETQASRRNRGRSSLGTFVSRILPSRRPEKGYTLRNEYQDGGPLSAADLVFGITEPAELQVPQGPIDSEDLKDAEAISGGPPGIARVQSQHSAGHDYGDRHGMGDVLLKHPEHDRRELSQGYVSPQQQQPPYPLPTFNFQNDPLGLDFQNPPADKTEKGEMSKTQQIYRAKKARREQRKSLLESGDFLGVQGANPRTGYWDTSTATSSSDPSQLSYETRKRLEQQAKDVEKQRAIYEEAQSKYNTGLERANTLRAKRESEKMEQKRLQSRLKQRRRGRWNAGDNGWSSVAEPELSPIRQSLAGTPARG